MGTDSLMGVKLDSLNNILNQPNYKEAKFDVPRLTLFIIVARGLVRNKSGWGEGRGTPTSLKNPVFATGCILYEI